MSGRSKDWWKTIMHTWCERHITIALCHVSPPYCWMEWSIVFAFHKSLLLQIFFLQNRKKGVVRGEERLDGKAAKRFLALPPHSLLFLTPLTFASDYLLCLHFWMKVFFLILTLSFSNISGSILRWNGRGMKICKYVLPSGICALLQRLWRDEPIQIASAVAKT